MHTVDFGAIMITMNAYADLDHGGMNISVLVPESDEQTSVARWFRGRQQRVADLLSIEPGASCAALIRAAGAVLWLGPPAQDVPSFGAQRHDGLGGDVDFRWGDS